MYYPPSLETTPLTVQAIHTGSDGAVNVIHNNRGNTSVISYYFRTNWTEFSQGVRIFYLLIGY